MLTLFPIISLVQKIRDCILLFSLIDWNGKDVQGCEHICLYRFNFWVSNEVQRIKFNCRLYYASEESTTNSNWGHLISVVITILIVLNGISQISFFCSVENITMQCINYFALCSPCELAKGGHLFSVLEVYLILYSLHLVDLVLSFVLYISKCIYCADT